MSVFCTECGANIPEGVRFCTECGAAGETAQPEPVTVAAATPENTPAPPPQQPYTPPQQPYMPPPQPAAAVYSGDAPPPPGSPYAAMGTGSFFGHTILFAIPVIGWLVCLVTAFAAKNRNKRNFARSTLLFLVVGLVLGGLFLLLFRSLLDGATEYINSVTDGMFGDLGGFGDLFGKMQNGLPGN